MIFIPELPRYDCIAAWRRGRRRRCLQTWANIILPNRRIRTQIFRKLCRWPWFRRFMSSKLGMVFFDRIVMPKFSKSEHELRTMDMDIRQVLSDNAIIGGFPSEVTRAADAALERLGVRRQEAGNETP